MNFKEKLANFVSGSKYQEQEKEPCAHIFSRVMDVIFLLSAGIALSEVLSVVQEKILGDQHTLVFLLKDLRRLYQYRLKYQDADEVMIKNVNVTMLKKQQLGEIPGLREQKNGTFVILTMEEDVGRAIVECLQNTWHDKVIILSKAARIVRRFLFTKEETFEGYFSKQRQETSVSFLC